MASQSNTLGQFLDEQMQRHGLNNSELARRAGVSESAVRNLLKHGVDSKAKDPNPRTLTAVAECLGVDPLKFYRLAGYIHPPRPANSVRAEYLADIFDDLPSEKQDAVMGVIEAFTGDRSAQNALHTMREQPDNALAGIDDMFPGLLRVAANQLIVQYRMVDPQDVMQIDDNVTIPPGNIWKELPETTKQRIISLIRYKLSAEYDPTLVDEKWR